MLIKKKNIIDEKEDKEKKYLILQKVMTYRVMLVLSTKLYQTGCS